MFVLEPARIRITNLGLAELAAYRVEDIKSLQSRCVVALWTISREEYIATLDGTSGDIFIHFLLNGFQKSKLLTIALNYCILRDSQAEAYWKEIDSITPKIPLETATARPPETAPVDSAPADAMLYASASTSRAADRSNCLRSGFAGDSDGARLPQRGPASSVLPVVEDSEESAVGTESLWVTELPRRGHVARNDAQPDVGVGANDFRRTETKSGRDSPKTATTPNERKSERNSEGSRVTPERSARRISTPAPPTHAAQNQAAITARCEELFSRTIAPNPDPRTTFRPGRNVTLPRQEPKHNGSVPTEHTHYPAFTSLLQRPPSLLASPSLSYVRTLAQAHIANDPVLPIINDALRVAVRKPPDALQHDFDEVKMKLAATRQRRDSIKKAIAELEGGTAEEGAPVKEWQEKELKLELVRFPLCSRVVTLQPPLLPPFIPGKLRCQIETYKITKDLADARRKIPALPIFPIRLLPLGKLLGGDVREVTATDEPCAQVHKASRPGVDGSMGLLKEVAILWALRGRGLEVSEVQGLVEDDLGFSGFLMPRFVAVS
ncbi:hypothetical protein BDK51DRAFT_48581 [Blyttiomyces helicus]|uniref:Uncharacterized protein n=1 Tax=Blyttiomyces helicus TaxID=388810 RepID=A0A4P9W1A4_9FUNG|nr:hypothetical protein BDK51DRAFT_48581 [Blyttiomyces helicus]|eukprot:RKO83846.1 hypothetical protein BDK51DRAFT_48581 [Blyttiomyces helicus]